MDIENISFEDMPQALAFLIGMAKDMQKEIRELKECCAPAAPSSFSIEELSEYLPQHPAKQTIYGWVSNKTIPYHKLNNKTLYFIKSEIDEWMLGGHSKTLQDIEAEAAAFLANKDKLRNIF